MSDRSCSTDDEAQPGSARQLADEIAAEIAGLACPNTPGIRAIRKRHSLRLRGATAEHVLDLAHTLIIVHGQRWVAYELVRHHPPAYLSLGEAALEELGCGIDSWGSTDSFARILAGPVWRDGLVSDETIHRWARSGDFWWRRAALVSTVALNVRSEGARGDVPRTLEVCRMLAGDRQEMVFKALSWALRELIVHDAQAVRTFLVEYEELLAARVKREVKSKLATGLKAPRRKPDGGSN